MLNDYAMQTNWAEVASAIEIIEGMHEDEFFSHRDLAALVASKVRRFSCCSYFKMEREKKRERERMVAFGDLYHAQRDERRF